MSSRHMSLLPRATLHSDSEHLLLVNSSVKKIKPAFPGKCITVAVACVEKAAEPKGVRRRISFTTRTGWNAPVSPIDVVVVKFTHAIARVLKRMKIWAGSRRLLGAGVTASFVASLPAAGSGYPASLCRGSCDCWVVAPPSIPEGVRSLHHGCSRFMGASSYCLSHGRWKANQKHCKKKVVR
jgi:hypothetical protein